MVSYFTVLISGYWPRLPVVTTFYGIVVAWGN